MLAAIRIDLQPLAQCIKESLPTGQKRELLVLDRYNQTPSDRVIKLKKTPFRPPVLATQTIAHGRTDKQLAYRFALEKGQQSSDPILSAIPKGGFVAGIYDVARGEFIRVTKKSSGLNKPTALQLLEYAFEECLICFKEQFSPKK